MLTKNRKEISFFNSTAHALRVEGEGYSTTIASCNDAFMRPTFLDPSRLK